MGAKSPKRATCLASYLAGQPAGRRDESTARERAVRLDAPDCDPSGSNSHELELGLIIKSNAVDSSELDPPERAEASEASSL